MSSSKIYRQDPEFTPTPLVRHELSEPLLSAETEMLEDPVATETVPEIEQEFEVDAQPEPAVIEQPPQPEPAPQPEIDIQAIQEEAYALGVNDARAQHDAELRPAVEALLTACQKLDTQRSLLMEQYKGDIINTIIALSKKILQDELQTKRDVIVSTLERALRQAIASDEFIVTLNPEDLQIIEEKQEEIISGTRGLEHIVLKTDQQITRGGCLLESNTCFIDATIESQLRNMEEALEEQTAIPDIDPDQLPE